MKFIASITNEKQSSAAMISDETQLVFLDEWSETTLQSDMVKTVLQGGLMVKQANVLLTIVHFTSQQMMFPALG